jgi:outer membrane protein
MKKQIVAAAVLMALGTGAAMAQAAKEGPWMVRVRAVNLDMANKNETPVAGLHVNDKTIPEVDISYFFDKNIAAELVLTVPQKQDVNIAGVGTIGTFKHLPPTLLVQYHWDMGGFKPYVGAGVNYTKISSVNLSGLPAGSRLSSSSTGLALQAGVDVPLGNGMYFNFDVKKVHIQTDVIVGGVGNIGKLKLDPLLVGVGLGWRF